MCERVSKCVLAYLLMKHVDKCRQLPDPSHGYYKSHSVDLAVAMDIKYLSCSDLVVGLLSWRIAIVVVFALQMRDTSGPNHVSDGYN